MLLLIFLKLRRTSDFGVFAVGAKPPILEFLRIVRRTSDFGVLDIINNIFETTQNLRFWSFCGGRKTSVFGVFAYSTQNLKFWSIKCYNKYFSNYAKPPILEFLRIVRRTSDFGGFAAGADPPKSE